MILSIFKALLVGVIAAIPIGPILVMVIQRTTCYGRRCGWMVGLGAATVDMLYAAIGLMAVQMLDDFIKANACWIMLIGGLVTEKHFENSCIFMRKHFENLSIFRRKNFEEIKIIVSLQP